MKQVSSNNIWFSWVVIFVIISYMTWNLLALFNNFNLFTLILISIHLLVVSLIFTRHLYAKIGLKIWAFLFFIMTSGLRLLGDLVDGFSIVDPIYYLIIGVKLSIGCGIIFFTNKYLVTIESKETTDD